jgi:hypothetical protein
MVNIPLILVTASTWNAFCAGHAYPGKVNDPIWPWNVDWWAYLTVAVIAAGCTLLLIESRGAAA